MDSQRLMLVGNSFTYIDHIPLRLRTFACGEGVRPPVETLALTRDAATLEDHAANRSFVASLKEFRPSHVVLQEQSVRPLTDRSRFVDAAQSLAAACRDHGASPRLLLTPLRREHLDRIDEVVSSYRGAAIAARAAVIGYGLSLARLVLRAPAQEWYRDDGIHPSPLGSYVGLCTLAAHFFGELQPIEVDSTLLSSDYGNPEEGRFLTLGTLPRPCIASILDEVAGVARDLDPDQPST